MADVEAIAAKTVGTLPNGGNGGVIASLSNDFGAFLPSREEVR